MKLFYIILTLLVFSCSNEDAKQDINQEISSSISLLLQKAQSQNDLEDFNYSELSSYTITKTDFKSIGLEDYETYKEWKEDFGDELASIMMDADDDNLIFDNISDVNIKVGRGFDKEGFNDENIRNGKAILEFNNLNKSYELDFIAVNTDNGWKIVLMEDLIPKEERRTKKSKSDKAPTEDDLNVKDIDWYGEWVYKNEKEQFSLVLNIDPRITEDNGRVFHNMCQLTGEGVQKYFIIDLIGVNSDNNNTFDFYYDSTIDGVFYEADNINKRMPILSLTYKDDKIISYFFQPDDIENNGKVCFTKR